MATQMNDENKILQALLAEIELPDSAYEKAVGRYEDLGAWLDRDASTVRQHRPHISPQGSFALGTAIYPLNPAEDYDLDLTCNLRAGINQGTHTQSQVKEKVRVEMELYRAARNIQENLEEKRRCWRLIYKDNLGFHLDTVPAIPADDHRRNVLIREMRAQGVSESVLGEVAAEAVWITDNTHPAYSMLTTDWLASNPRGYVRWFQSRLTGATALTEVRAKVDDIPVYRRKTPLQQVVQLLKRHRDVMFQRNPDSKPISAIITTIAARGYQVGESLAQTMMRVLRALDDFRRSNSSVVLNPVNPEENFADKWSMADYAKLNLKQNAHDWIEQVVADFPRLMRATSADQLVREASRGLKVAPNAERTAGAFAAGVSNLEDVERVPRIQIKEQPPKPWRNG